MGHRGWGEGGKKQQEKDVGLGHGGRLVVVVRARRSGGVGVRAKADKYLRACASAQQCGGFSFVLQGKYSRAACNAQEFNGLLDHGLVTTGSSELRASHERQREPRHNKKGTPNAHVTSRI